jgi:hypothetical protein
VIVKTESLYSVDCENVVAKVNGRRNTVLRNNSGPKARFPIRMLTDPRLNFGQVVVQELLPSIHPRFDLFVHNFPDLIQTMDGDSIERTHEADTHITESNLHRPLNG